MDFSTHNCRDWAEYFLEEISFEFDRLQNKYGKTDIDTQLEVKFRGEDIILRKENPATEWHTIVPSWVLPIMSSYARSENPLLGTIIPLFALTAYLLYRFPPQAHDPQPCKVDAWQLFQKINEPIDSSFLSETNLNDKTEIQAVLSYLEYLSFLKHGPAKMNIDPVTVIKRIILVYGHAGEKISNVEPKTMQLAILTGYTKEKNLYGSFSQSNISISKQDVETALPFLLFLDAAKNDDVFHAGNDYGKWKLMSFSDDGLERMFKKENETAATVKLADGLTKQEIIQRVLPMTGILTLLSDDIIENLPRTIKCRAFDSLSFPVEEAFKIGAEISENMRKSIFSNKNEYDAQRKYHHTMQDISQNEILRIMKNTTSDSKHTQDMFVTFDLMKLKIFAAYTKNPLAMHNKLRLFNAFATLPLIRNLSHNKTEESINIIEAKVKIALLEEIMDDDKIAEFLINARQFAEKEKDKRIINANKWKEIANIFATEKGTLYEWAYKVVFPKM